MTGVGGSLWSGRYRRCLVRPCSPCLIGLLVAIAACEEKGELEMRVTAPAVTVGEVIAARLPSLVPDSFALSLPADVELRGDTIAVLDRGNDRIVLFDSALQPLAEFGRSGAGPGELNGAVSMEWVDEEFIVFDAENQRITRFGSAGNVLAARRVPAATAAQNFALDAEGTAFVPYPWPNHLLLRIAADGSAKPFGERPEAATPHPTRVSLDRVAVTDGGVVHVLDWQYRLHRIDPSGEVTRSRALPADFLAYERQQAGRLEALARNRSRVTATAPNLTTTAEGDLLISVPDGGGAIGLLVDPDRYEAAVLRVPANHPLRYLGHSALRDSTLFALTMDGIRLFRVRRQ